MGRATISSSDAPKTTLKVADEVWIATALLHREHPTRQDFGVQEIVERAAKENITGTLRAGVSVHAYLHCVANRPPNSAQYRMLFETSDHVRRLFRQGDAANPGRKGKVIPEAADLPQKYLYLLEWYRKEFDTSAKASWLSGIFELSTAGKELFAGVDADAYVDRLREGWN
jgi:hypothetical protein